MNLWLDDLLGCDSSSMSEDDLLGIKRKLTDRIMDMYFEGEVHKHTQELFIAWIFDDDGAEMKEAAMLRRFEMLFDPPTE